MTIDSEKIHEVMQGKPGLFNRDICKLLGAEPGDRAVDRALQKLRRHGLVEFSEGRWVLAPRWAKSPLTEGERK